MNFQLQTSPSYSRKPLRQEPSQEPSNQNKPYDDDLHEKLKTMQERSPSRPGKFYHTHTM
jgi:hypothetical protein